MNTIEIPDINQTFEMPSHLGECNPRQYAMLSRLLFQYQFGEIDYYQFKVGAVYQLLNMKPTKIKDTEAKEKVEANIFQLTELVDDFFEEKKGMLMIRQEFQHNPIPQIPISHGNLYGPSDYMRSTVFGEYVDALNLFGIFIETRNVNLLYNLAAILYRPKGKKYNPDKVDRLSDRLKKTDFGYIYGVFLYLASFQNYLGSARIMWEGKELDLSILFKSSEKSFKSSIPGLGMKSTAYMLAENGILGNLKEVNNTPTWEVLLLLYDLKKNDLDRKAQEKSIKK